jgi:hypothetical protein
MISRLLDQQLVTKPEQLTASTSSASRRVRSTFPGNAVPEQIPLADMKAADDDQVNNQHDLSSPVSEETEFFIDESDVKHV